MEKIKQSQRILRHLEDVGPITNASAMYEYGIGHLASRISEMRRDGVPIGDKMVARKNRYGETVHFKECFLEGK